MKIEQALELAIKTLDATADDTNERTTHYNENLRENLRDILNLSEAIKVLREGEQPVEVVEEVMAWKCKDCGYVGWFRSGRVRCENCKLYSDANAVPATKTRTTNRRLTIETVESVPVFEEIDDE